MIFSFNLYAISLLATLVAYFRTELRDLVNGEPSESNKVCYYQH